MVRRARSVRRGLGAGKGTGYKNLIPKDPMVHSQSSKGIKQPQRVNIPIPEPPVEPKVAVTSEEEEMEGLFGSPALSHIKGEIDGDIDSFREDEDGVWTLEGNGKEYMLFEDEDKAEAYAIRRVREDLEDSPDMFAQSWLENFVTMTDTDRRIIAGEESDNLVDEVLDDDEIIKNSDYQEEYNGLQDGIDAYENKFEDGLSNESEQKLQAKIDALEKEKEELIDKAKEDARSTKYDEIYEALKDPINYFVDEQGIYSKEELLKQSFISIDVDEATEDAINTDGWEHFIATYDGDSQFIVGGYQLARLN